MKIRFLRFAMPAILSVVSVTASHGQSSAGAGSGGMEVYRQIKAFSLGGGGVSVSKLTLKRDRAVITFESGALYFSAPVEGQVRGAVFVGAGTVHADAPPIEFEKDNLKRMLKSDAVDADFKTAVLRFTDDSFDTLGKGVKADMPAPPEAAKLAAEFDRDFMKETGVNLPSRMAVSILDGEKPGFFLAQFDKGKRGRFTFIFDAQCRIPVAAFAIDAGEKGLFFGDRGDDGAEVWTAFHGEEEYRTGQAEYADVSNLVDIPHYDLRLDLREKGALKMTSRMDLVSRAGGVRAIPFALSEGLPSRDDMRRKKGLRAKTARTTDGVPVDLIQEDWESGFTVLLPNALQNSQKLALEVDVEGAFVKAASDVDTFYPFSNETWYPRHARLARSTFDLTFLHRKNYHVASAGKRLREEPAPGDKDALLTEFRIDVPIPIVTFAAGPFEIHSETAELPGGTTVPVEYYSLPGRLLSIKEDFMMAELGNALRYFSTNFGAYPYPAFRGVFHPYPFGQGFPTMLMIPPEDTATDFTFFFLSHETSHQWWGDAVLWRSYRDQWLSEGFATYSGLLYAGIRTKQLIDMDLLRRWRVSLKDPPHTELGIGKGRLTDIGPIFMGHRLSTRESWDAYQALIYNKGALVLRMMHFLFADPQTGDGRPFFDMMKDFVKKYQHSSASTEEFFAIANERIAQTPLAKRYGFTDLNWFLRQWVMQTYLPSYRLEYRIETQSGGQFALKGTLFQDGLPGNERWFMPLPLVLHFGDKMARGTITANGPKTEVTVPLPAKPDKVELDPDLWILSEKTETKEVKR